MSVAGPPAPAAGAHAPGPHAQESPGEKPRDIWFAALALSLGAAVSLGLARFSYALLLPLMRADLGWSYFTAGAMNTVNAAGYLAGALLAPMLMKSLGARATLLGGSVFVALVLALHGAVRADAVLYALRFAAGMGSAAVFVAGGLLAARLGARCPPGAGMTPSLVLGLYYGGAGLGVVVSALLVPPLAELRMAGLAGWAWGWCALAGVAALVTLPMAWGTRGATSLPGAAVHGPARFRARPFAFGLAAYFVFGLGYIGYMTFIVALLREQQMSAALVAAFYALLGVGVMASPWLWAGLLQRSRGGRALALLSALLAVATALPVLLPGAVPAFVSGLLFGGVMLSIVASTTALVRHNLPAGAWSGGISAFTIVFAVGQIVGPSIVGLLADGRGGLRAGLLVSAAALLIGALLASRQKPLQ